MFSHFEKEMSPKWPHTALKPKTTLTWVKWACNQGLQDKSEGKWIQILNQNKFDLVKSELKRENGQNTLMNDVKNVKEEQSKTYISMSLQLSFQLSHNDMFLNSCYVSLS